MTPIWTLAATAAMLMQPIAVSAGELIVARENTVNFPWQLMDGMGADTYLIETAARNLGYAIEFKKVPWNRCLNQIANNNFDGCYSASFKPERMGFGVYPMADGKPDPAKRTHTESYSLYTLKSSPADWTGQTFKNLDGDVGAIYGYSVVDVLKENNASVFEGDDLDQLFKMLIAGNLSGVASLTSKADYYIQSNPDLQHVVRKVEVPLVKKHYYLMLSHKLAQDEPELAAALYDEIEKVRQSEDYQKYFSSLFK